MIKIRAIKFVLRQDYLLVKPRFFTVAEEKHSGFPLPQGSVFYGAGILKSGDCPGKSQA
jgi:hypothetical protein